MKRRVAEAATKKIKPFNFAVLTDAHLYDIKGHKFDNLLEKAVAIVNKISPCTEEQVAQEQAALIAAIASTFVITY